MMLEIMREEGVPGNARIVILHPEPTSRYSAIYISLACLSETPVAYLVPYEEELIPAWVDSYAIGMWDIKKGEWIAGTRLTYRNPSITDDGAGIYTYNRVQMRQLLSTLDVARRNLNVNRGFLAGMASTRDTNITGLWGWYDVVGIEEALAYLGCFDDLR